VRDDVLANEELVKAACLAVARAPWIPLPSPMERA